MVNVWAGLPFFIILLLAGLKAIDGEQYDAAAVDGATRLAAVPARDAPGHALRHHRGDAALDDLHVQQLHA